MTFADLLKELIATSKERVKTPIAGAYFLSFLLWNWRPILFLIFEKVSITQKIIIINNEYCNIWAIIGPLVLGLFFTVGVTYLMAFIDWALKPAKKIRLKIIYQTKNDDINEQLQLVEAELKLQDKRNRSKTTEDFEIKISELENQIETEKSSHKVVVEGYQNRVKELTEKLQNQYDAKTLEIEKHAKTKLKFEFIIMMLKTDFNRLEFNFMNNIKLPLGEYNHFDKDLIDKKILNFLIEKKLAKVSSKGFQFTERGEKFIEFIKSYDSRNINIQFDSNGKPLNSFLLTNID